MPYFPWSEQPISLVEAVAISFTTLALSLSYVVVCRLYFSPLSVIPGPKLAALHPIFSFRFAPQPPDYLLDLHKTYGPVVRTGPNEVSVSSGDDVASLYTFKTALPKAALYDVFRSPELKGPMFAMRSNNLHGARRKLINPAYSRASILTLQPFIVEQVGRLLSSIEHTAKASKSVDLWRFFRTFVGDTVLKLAFDVDQTMLQTRRIHPVIEYLKIEVSKTFHIPYLRPLYRRIPVGLRPYLFSANLIKRLGALDTINKLALDLVEQYLEKKEEGAVEDTVLARIVDAKDPETGETLTTPEIAAEARSIIVAGGESTATSLSYAIWLIYTHPHVLARLREELQRVMPDDTVLPNNDTILTALEALPYLSAVIHETLRLYPAVWGPWPRDVPAEGVALGRRAIGDGVGKAYAVPAGTTIAASPYVVHRLNPRVWGDDGEAFRPERWLEADEAALAQMHTSFISFGTGPRSCIGRRVAMMQLHLVLAAFLSRYPNVKILTPAANMELKGSFLLSSFGGDLVVDLGLDSSPE